jgi:hypothetical protein
MLAAALLRMGCRTTRLRSPRLRPELLMRLQLLADLGLPVELGLLAKLGLLVELRLLTILRLRTCLRPLHWTIFASLEVMWRTRLGPLLGRALEALLRPAEIRLRMHGSISLHGSRRVALARRPGRAV